MIAPIITIVSRFLVYLNKTVIVKLLPCIFIIPLIHFCAFSQDVHWSQVNRQPLYQNPANTGNFNGDIRLTGNFKNQWRSVTVPFNTFALGFDLHLKKMKGASIGGLFINDQAGNGKFKTIELQILASKEKYLAPDSIHKVTFGIQIGFNYRQVNFNKLTFDNQFNGVLFDPTIPSSELYANDSRSNLNSGIGLQHQVKLNPTDRLTTGLAFFNLNRPNQGFYGAKVSRPIRTNIVATYFRKLDTDWSIEPGISYNHQKKYNELIIGSQVNYVLVDRLGIYQSLRAGLWFRNKDAFILRGGIAVQDWSAEISYDVNISKLRLASNVRGGFEFSLHYIIRQFKPKKIVHRICPDYI